LFLVLTAVNLSSYAQSKLYMVSRDDDSLRIVDSATVSIDTTVVMTATGVVIDGATGLAIHPCSGVPYLLLKISGQSGRSLATVDSIGNVSIIGNTGDNFASIAFDNNGILYGVTGDGANTSETLFTLNLNTAAATFAATLGNG